MNINLIEETKTRLIYSFYISNEHKSIDDHIAYIIHLICLKYCLENFYKLFDECIFIIHCQDINNELINIIKQKLSIYSINIQNVKFIIEKNIPEYREGIIFKKYILDKLDEYDGLTLFFHNKGFNINFYGNDIKHFPLLWVVNQYYYLMSYEKEYLGNFIRNNNKLIFGWPYVGNATSKYEWLIAGACYWMKCKKIYKHIKYNNINNAPLTIKMLAEYYFLETIEKKYIDYPNSYILKYDNDNYNLANDYEYDNYLKNNMFYNEYINMKYLYDGILNNYNAYINKKDNII